MSPPSSAAVSTAHGGDRDEPRRRGLRRRCSGSIAAAVLNVSLRSPGRAAGDGHATVSITLDTYSHAIPALQEEAAERIAGLMITAR